MNMQCILIYNLPVGELQVVGCYPLTITEENDIVRLLWIGVDSDDRNRLTR